MKRTASSYRVDGLEPRILLSADPLGLAENVLPARNADEPALVEDAVRDLSFAAASVDLADGSLDDQVLVPTSVVPDATHLLAAVPLEIVFVDAATPDYDTLVDSLLDENPLRDLRVHVLDANSDGFQSIAEILSGYEEVDAIHLISHGSSGSLTLGDAVLNDASVDAHAQSLAAWGNSFTDDADLLIYGCDFAAGEGGREIVARLATLTGADIAASTDLTGAAALGGDWDLEYRHGDVEAAIALNLSAQAEFDGVLAAPTPAGGETLVNVTTTGVQEKASVAMYADGDYVVAWQNNDATNFGEILMRRYNADGTAKDGADVAVHIPGITNESNPSVAVSANGNFVVAWQSNNGSGEDIFAAVYDTDGNTIKSAFVVNSTSGFAVGNQAEPDVSMDASGNFVVSWEGKGPGGENNGVFARRFDADGSANGAEFQVNPVNAGTQTDARVDMNASGAFVVSWTEQAGGGSISAALYDNTGAIVDDSIVAGTGVDGKRTADVGMDDAGRFVIVWEENTAATGREILHRLFDAAGSPIDTDGTLDATANPVQVNTFTSGDQLRPSVSMNGNGDYVISWTTSGFTGDAGAGISAREYAADGSARDAAEFHVNTTGVNSQDLSAIAINDSRAIVAVWSGEGTQSGNVDADGVFFQRYAAAGPNTAPSVSLANTVTSFAENTDTTSRVKVADISITDDGLGTNNITLTGTDAALFEVDGTELFLKAGTTLDFETNATLDVTVTVDDASVGGTPDDSVALAISVSDSPEVVGPLLFSTEADVSAGGQSGTDTFQQGDVVQVSDSGLALGDGTTAGTVSLAFDIDAFALGANVDALHHVANDITLGTSSFQLQAGDLLLSVDGDETLSSGSTPSAPFTNSLTVGDEDVFVFRPDTAGDYRTGTFAMLLEAPSGENVRAVTLVEKDTVVGDVTLSKGDFLLARDGAAGDDVFLFQTTDVGAGSTSGSVSVLLDGDDAGVSFDKAITGLDLVETSVTAGGVALDAGTLLVSFADATSVGSNALAVTGSDAVALDVSATTLQAGAGNGSVTATRVFDGAGVALDSNDERLDALSLNVAVTATNEAPAVNIVPVVSTLAEATDTASRIKVADLQILDDGLGTNALALAGADATLFELDGTELFIKAGTTLDFETNATLDVTVTVDDASVGGTPDDSVALAISVSDSPEVVGPLLFSTEADVSAGGQSGTDTFQQGDVVQVSDSGLALGDGTTAGTVSLAFDIDAFALGANVDALHHVANDITLGTSSFQLQAGDLLLSVDGDETLSSGSTPSAPFTNSLTVGDEDVFVFRPDTAGDYRTGTFAMLLEAPSGENVRAVTLVEKDTVVGDVTLSKGDFLLARDGAAGDDVFLFQTTDVGAGSTSGSVSVLLDGDDAGVSFDKAITGLDLVETSVTAGGVALDAGTLLVSFADATSVGSNALAVTGSDAVALDVSATTLQAGAGNGSVTATRVFDGAGVALDSNDERLDALSLNVTVAPTNAAPEVALANATASLAEDTDTTSRVKVADVNVSDDGNGTNTLALTGADAALFELDGNELFLKAGTSLDFETNETLDVTVSVDDNTVGGTPDDSAALAISVTDVNEAPTVSLANTATSLAENTDITSRLKVADINVADDALGSETLALTGTDAALFEIDGTELFIKAGTSLDFETNATLDVTVTVDDNTVGGNPDDSVALAINLTDVNEAPSVSLANTITSFAENTSTASRVKVADIVVSDDALGSETLKVVGAGNAFFEIDGTELFIRAGETLDFESTPTLDVTVSVDDTSIFGNPDDTASMTVTLTDVNEAPTVALANTVTNLAENTDTTARVKVADINITDDALGTETLALSGTDAALFEIDGTELFLKAGTSVDHETNGTLDVTVSVDDNTVGGTPDDSAALAINITDVNEAPTVSLANTVTNLAENTDTTSRVKVADINVTDDALGSETLALTGADAALFEIDGTELFIKAGTSLDFETNATLDVTVAVDDNTVGGNPDDTAVLAIAVTDVNEAPSVALANTTTALADTTSTAARIKVADINVSDDALGAETLVLTGTDAALFEIDGAELFIKAGTVLNATLNPSLDVTVNVDDATVGGIPDDTAALSIAITNGNAAPTVSLANTVTSLLENTDITSRVKVADINVSDDGNGTNTLAVAGTDAALFEIDGTELFIKAGTTLDFESATSLDVTVTVDDATIGVAPEDSAALTVNVTDVNEAPTLSLANTVTNLAENTDTTARVKVADINVADDALGSETLALTGTDAALFEIDGTQLFLRAGTTLDFETNATLDVTVTVDDATVGGNPDDTAALAINVFDVNETPSVALSNTVTNLSEDTNTASRVKVADISITDDALGAETLGLTGTDAALFEIDGTELFLKAGTTLDFESNAALDVTVTVDDNTVGGNPDDTAALAITVTDANEAPTVALANTVTNLAENTDTTSRVKVADVSVTDDALGTETITLTGTDAALFEVDGTELFLKAGTTLDFETNATLDVTVNVDDNTVGGNPDDTAALSIGLTDVNEAPTAVALANATTSLAEDTNTTARVKVADIDVSDDALGVGTLTLTGADVALFEIDGTQLFLKAGTVLDSDAKPNLSVTVNVDDATVGGAPDATVVLSITVAPAAVPEEAPALVEEEEEVAPAAAPVVAEVELVLEGAEDEAEDEPEPEPEDDAAEVEAAVAAETETTDEAAPEDELDALAAGAGAVDDGAVQAAGATGAEQGRDSRDGAESGTAVGPVSVGVAAASNQLFAGAAPGEFVQVDALLGSLLNQFFAAAGDGSGREGDAAADAELAPVELVRMDTFVSGMDRLREQAEQEAALVKAVVSTGVAASTGVSVGYVVWLIRGGVLLSSVLSSMPAWRFIDPLPILDSAWEATDGDGDDDSLESMVARAADRAGAA